LIAGRDLHDLVGLLLKVLDSQKAQREHRESREGKGINDLCQLEAP